MDLNPFVARYIQQTPLLFLWLLVIASTYDNFITQPAYEFTLGSKFNVELRKVLFLSLPFL